MYFDILRINEPLLNDFLRVRINMHISEVKAMRERAAKRVKVKTVTPDGVCGGAVS